MYTIYADCKKYYAHLSRSVYTEDFMNTLNFISFSFFF